MVVGAIEHEKTGARMRKPLALLLLPLVLFAGTRCRTGANAGASPPNVAAAELSDAAVRAENDEYVARVLAAIAGREDEPAETVFKNVQWLKGIPASRFLRIMNGGYSRALGVTCTHCHRDDDFASDEKREKRAAREMAVMHRMINERLRAMQNLSSDPTARPISCSTCHRGQVDPNAANN